MKYLDKLISYGLYLFVFLLPWQTRWIFKDASLNGETWEYGRLSLYGSEILLLLILSLGIIKWLAFYQKLNKTERIQYFKKEFKGLKLWVILLIVWSAVTILWSGDKLLAWYGWLKLVEGIGLFWLTSHQLFKISHYKVKWALLSAGAIQSILAIWQWLNQWSFASKWLGMSSLNPATLGVSVIDNGVGRFLRSYGSLPHPNILASFLVICLVIAIVMIVQQKKTSSLLLGIIAVLSIGLFLTFSRAGWLILVLCLAIYWIICIVKKINLKKLFWASLMIIVIFEALSWFYSDLVRTRLVSESRLEVKSNQERFVAYDEAQDIIKKNLFFGVGLSQYTLALYQKNPTLSAWAYQPVHDNHILILAELGLVGLLLVTLIIYYAIKTRNHYWLLLLAILFLGVFDHYFRSFYFGIMLWWLVIALSIKLNNN